MATETIQRSAPYLEQAGETFLKDIVTPLTGQRVKTETFAPSVAAYDPFTKQAQQMAAQQTANENYQNELDRVNKKEIAIINAMSKEGTATQDLDNSGSPDSLEIEKLSIQQSTARSNYDSKMADINSKNSLAQQKLQIEREKISLARDNQANDLAVAKMNAKGRKK